MLSLRPARTLAIAAPLLVALPARADVLITETIAQRVARSGVVAVAAFIRTDGTAPFTNAKPPTAEFRVTRAIRGCRRDDVLRVPEWGKAPPPGQWSKRPPTPAEKQAADKQWAETAITPPQPGAEFILLLDGEGSTHAGRAGYHIPAPGSIPAPDARQIELIAGFATFSVEVGKPDELRVPRGAPVPLSLTVRNDSAAPARFDLATLRLAATTPGGERQAGLRPTASPDKPLPAWTLAPGARQGTTVDLARLFPGVFVAPGHYWLELELPAQGGDVIRRHVELFEASMAYLCGPAAVVLRARVAAVASTSQVTLEDAVYLRLRGDHLAPRVDWIAATPAPRAKDRWILCGEGGHLVFAEPDTDEARGRLRGVVAGDPPGYWSTEEDKDPRFAPPTADAPGSELRRIGLDRRLRPLP